MKRILFINRFFYPDHSATSQLLGDVCFFLAARGFDIHVLTSRQLYEDAARNLPAFEEIHGVQVHRVWTSKFGRSKLYLRSLDYLTFYLSTVLFCLFWLSSGDAVVAKTDPPMIGLVARVAAKFRGARLINWVQDLYPDAAVASGLKFVARIGPLLEVMRNISLRGAFLNVVIGDLMAKRLRGYGVAAGQIRVQPNWSDGAEIVPLGMDRNPLRRGWDLENKFIVGYSGNMGRLHEFSTILDAIGQLQHREDICFLFIGSGAQRGWMEAQVSSAGYRNVLFKPYQPQAQLINSLGLPDVHLVTLRPEFEGIVVPSKFYGIAAAGRATIYVGDRDGEVPGILAKAECGRTVAPGDGDGLVQAIVALEADRDLVAQMGSNARDYFMARFDKQVALSAWRDIAIAATA